MGAILGNREQLALSLSQRHVQRPIAMLVLGLDSQSDSHTGT
jgi:hypothetical protein